MIVNGVTAFGRDFGNTATPCRWVDETDGDIHYLHITHAELRAAQAFIDFKSPDASLTVARDELVIRIESLIGDLIWLRDDVKWGEIHGRPVEISKESDNTLAVDLDLEATFPTDPTVPGTWPSTSPTSRPTSTPIHG